MLRLPADVDKKQRRLLQVLSGYRRVVVAFSGGVDSAVLAKAAQLACGEGALAITAVSHSLPEEMHGRTHELAALIGIRHVELPTDEFDRVDYTRNAPDRCYFCKDTLYRHIQSYLAKQGLTNAVVVNGANADDVGDHRPGMRAASDHNACSPLLESGLTKPEVRQLAQHWELPVWDQPAAPCLSSRIAYGLEVTPERVQRVDRAEQFLKEMLDIAELRVRHEAHDLARLELPADALATLLEQSLRVAVVARLKELGFRYVTLDLEGFRSGSMNDVIPIGDLQRFDQP